MNTSRRFSMILISTLVLTLLLGVTGIGQVNAQTATPGLGRALVYLYGYATDPGTLMQGTNFTLKMDVRNKGDSNALNVVFTFTSDTFLPLQTGGVKTLSDISKDGGKEGVNQPFMVNTVNKGAPATIAVAVSYSDETGASYSENFTITLYVSADATKQPIYGTPRPSATPTAIRRPQLVVNSYNTDIDPLQPGSIFQLELNVRNLGNADARAVTMVLGGGVVSSDTGTPQPGTQGSSSDLTTFAPLGSSNLVFLGDVTAAQEIKSNQKLIVNVSANPGAYTFKISFVYTDPGGVRYVDDQVITLLVYKLPQVEVSLYQDPGVFFAGQMGMLPLQVTNLGRSSAVLGNMKITAENADISNNSALVGILDAGGYFTLDASLMPYQAGPLELKISINYTDDFNQPRVIEQTLTVDVQEMPVVETPPGGMPEEIPAAPETFMGKLVRLFKGLFGLGSEQTEPVNTLPEETIPGGKEVIPVIPGGKG
ncbi:hypothetical protein LARV_00651 [Longilinea arvoryzae]|uniref:CARDB domain-containing protein n=1 Tax=Longilinea arvoryzae TaxID=360412 RepID=A0A0S7B6S8_9CHLR|nr:hypothetical protein [Longilinea arvoryzae]GAP12911.1 hypothetical protein LARV_00651 [Longilinea arvoryzae]